ALIGLARLGTGASFAAPSVMQCIVLVDDPYFHARCFDALAALLEDEACAEAREAVDMLTLAFQNPQYRRMRGRIARTLLKIGIAARRSIPALAATLRGGAPGSVRVPVKRTLIWMAVRSWTDESAATQR